MVNLLKRYPNWKHDDPLSFLAAREKEAFQLGNYLLKMTVNEVALILGLPNAGLRFTFSRSPIVDKTHKNLTEEIHRTADEEGSPMLEGRRLCMLFDHLSRVSTIRNAVSNIGSLEGCATVLLVWMYEHSKLQPSLVDLARPRVCRWYPTLKYSAKFCMKVQENFFIKNYVKKKFMNVLDEEKVLLGEEDDDSDFETPPPRKDKRRRVQFATIDVVGEKLGYENKIDEKRSIRIKEKILMRKIRSEMKIASSEEKNGQSLNRKDEHVQSDEDWRGLESDTRNISKKRLQD
ncbi:hypothetical protein KSP40_PGU001734 [Platanthera guangdongensis]|uniref:Aminotransferase-like plant mobile domain-containing protein n=1 Tax=Platanthera guangdongensis TaxID=2320717 RepID=A0ABR2M538_9ASPA